MKKNIFILATILLQAHCIAQAPNIQYSSPQTFSIGVAITPVNPTNTGGAVPASNYGNVAIFAGSGVAGDTNGLGTVAKFNSPLKIAIDPSNNMYISDSGNKIIRTITPNGLVGYQSADSGYYNGTNNIHYDFPKGIEWIGTNSVCVVDSGNDKVVKAGGISVNDFSGSGVTGMLDGSASVAQFASPTDIVRDANGNYYVTDGQNDAIRKITSYGSVTTIAGSTSGISGYADGIGTAARFYYPDGIALDAAGNIYVADTSNNRIRKITPTGVVTTIAGNGSQGSTDGTGTGASFYNPKGIVLDALGNIFVADTWNSKIRKISPTGVVTTFASNSLLARPSDLAFDSLGNLFVVCSWNNIIVKIPTWGYSISPALPTGLSFNNATGIITGTPTVAITPTTYTVTAYNASGSSTSTIVISTTTLGTTSFEKEEFKCYPNPVNDLLKITNTFKFIGSKFSIVDITGKIVLQGTIDVENSINVNGLTKGIYTLTIDTSFYKFIKE